MSFPFKNLAQDKSALFISGIYVLFSILWIFFSDIFVQGLAGNSSKALSMLQTVKGALFVCATGLLIYVLVRVRVRKLVESEERYRSLVGSMHDIIYSVSPDGNILFIGPQIKRYNLNAAELAGKPFTDFVHPEDKERIRKEFEDTLSAGTQIISDFRISNKEDQEIWFEEIGHIVRDKKGDIVSISGMLRDISERKASEERQKKLETQLRQSQKMQAIGQLAGGIAHDFNNVLGAIIGYADLALCELADNNPLVGYMNNILRAGDRAKHMVSQILTFSRQGVDEKTPVNLRPIVNEVIELFRATLPSTVTLIPDVAKDTCPVIADATKVHEILMNLATNAVHAMDEKGELRIVLKEDEPAVQKQGILGPIEPGFYSIIEVTDTGTGIDPAIIDHIFEPFFTTKDAGKGTGLGLSVVYGVMHSHKGNIEVESSLNKGTVFRLYFPKTNREAVADVFRNPQVPGGNERILFVDDESLLVEMNKTMLTSLGYKVTAITDSREALELLLENMHEYDLLITDQTMPHMTGIELAYSVLQLNPEFPIILCTGFSSKVDEKKAIEIGCRAFAAKPLTKSVLAVKIREALDGKKNTRQK